MPDSEDIKPRVTASELAFLALGLLLGAALGAAAIVTLGSRPPRREIRVTVTRDALPRRSETLSQDAFVTSLAEIARGGPGDRRRSDRAGESPALMPVMATPSAAVGDLGAPSFFASEPARRAAPIPAPAGANDRTIVPYVAGSVGVEIRPDPDPLLDDLRVPPSRGSLLERMLRGEHRAMVEAVDLIAGEDSRRRRDWELLLGGLIEAMGEVAVEESVIDFPMGTAFWDTFTVEQCRRVVGALASMGYRYDGRSGWLDQRFPAYRDITQALADIGVEPRRVRAWPNSGEIAELFVGARPAPEELLAAAGPAYGAVEMRELLGTWAEGLADLWVAWDSIREVLVAEEAAPEPAAAPAGEAGPDL